jgi:hypothetical protein
MIDGSELPNLALERYRKFARKSRISKHLVVQCSIAATKRKIQTCTAETRRRGEDKTNFLPLMALMKLIDAHKPKTLRSEEVVEVGNQGKICALAQ